VPSPFSRIHVSRWQEMRSISTLPGAAARATKSKDHDARLQRGRPSLRRALPFQARHSKSNPGTFDHPHGHASATTRRSRSPIGGVNTDRVKCGKLFRQHARETKRAGPERAFERDALKVQRATAHSMPLRALTRERRAGTRRTPRTPRLQPRRPNVRSSGASRRAPQSLSGVPPQVRHLLPAVEGWRTGCPAQAGALAAGVTGRPAGSCPPTHGGQCLAALAGA